MKLRRLLPLALALLLALSLCACSGAAAVKNSDADYAMEYVPEAELSSGRIYAPNGGLARDDAVDSPAVPQESGASAAEGAVTTNRKLIRTVSLNVETEDCAALVAKITADVSTLGGYLESSDVRQGKYPSASLKIRVPAKQLDAFLAWIGETSNVTWRSENTEDVTLQYTDTESRIKALKVEQERLTELLSEAANLTELLELEDRLTEVRYQLEYHSSLLRTLDSLVEYSTVNVEISQVEVFTQVEEPGYWAKLGQGFVDSLSGVGEFFTGLFAWFVTALPYLVVFLVVPGVIVWIVVASIVKKHRKRRAARKDAEKEVSVQ